MAPWVAEDTVFFRLETEEEGDADADKEVAGPETFGILRGEDMIHPVGGEIVDRLRGEMIERTFGSRADVKHSEIDESTYTYSAVKPVCRP